MSAAVIWGLLSALGYGLTDFAARFSGRMAGVWRTMLYGQTAVLILATAWFLFNRGSWSGDLEDAPLLAWIAAVAASLVMLGATAMLYRGLSSGRLAVVAPVTAAYGAVTAVLEAIAGQSFPAEQAAGLALAVCGAAFSAVPPRTAAGAVGPSGLGWALGAAASYGLGFWIQGAVAVPALGPLIPLWLYYSIGPVTLLLVGRMVGQPLDRPKGRAFATVLATGLLAASGSLALVLGYRTGAVAVVTVLSSLASAVTVLLARGFLGEPVRLLQWFGLAVLIVGLGLIHSA
jgi:drug/metabolite transporter (DMT)-like permease